MTSTETGNDENFTYEDLVDEISAFIEANRDISDIEFQCLLDEAFKLKPETSKSVEVKDEPSKQKKISEKKLVLNKTWFPKKVFLFFLMVFPALLMVSYASNQSLPSAVYKVAASHFDLPPYLDLYFYLYLRPIRMMSVYLDLPQRESLPECYLSNPFIPLEEVPEMFPDECKCQNTKHILAALSNATASKESSVNLNADFLADQPILLKSWGRKAKLNDLWDILKKSGALLKEVPNTVTCNHDEVSSMKEFVDTKIFSTIIKNNSLHLEWLSNHYIGCSVIKDLFPVPSIVKENYYDTARILQIDGPTSDAYELPQARLTFITAYIQGASSRKILLIPKHPCQNRCRILSARLDAGDILLFSQSAYTARSEHVDDSISLSSVVSLDDGESEFS